MKKKRNHNTRLIKANYSYYVEQVADLFGVDIATVRRWIREDGLKRIPNTRPHLIHSNDLRAFIEKLKTSRKKPCASYEAFCFPCKSPRTPKVGSATITHLPNGCICFKALCPECGGVMNRNIRGADWTENHPLVIFLNDATGQHRGVHPAYRECSLQTEGNDA